MASSRGRLALAVLLVATAFATTAQAEPTAAEKETARGLMSEGRARRERNDTRGALESFRAADAIMHVPTTGFEVARSQVALGQLVEAADTLRVVLRIPVSPSEPAPFAAARSSAQSLLEDVESRVPSVRVITVKDANVAVDDVSLPPAAIGEPFKVDPGRHVVRVARGDASATREVNVAEREAKIVSIAESELATGASPPPVATSAPSDPEPPHEDSAPPRRSHTMRTVAWTGVAVAGVGAVAGSIAGILSLSHTSSAKSFCSGDQCQPAAQGDLDAAHTTATISTIAFVVAGAGATAAVVGFLVGDPREPPRAGRVVPIVGPGVVGARVAF